MSTSLAHLRRRTAVAAMAAGLVSFGTSSTDRAAPGGADDAGGSTDERTGHAEEHATGLAVPFVASATQRSR